MQRCNRFTRIANQAQSLIISAKLAVIEGFWARTGPYIRFLYRHPFAPLSSGHPHNAIIEGLKKKDAVKVESELRLDINYHWAILVRHASEDSALRD